MSFPTRFAAVLPMLALALAAQPGDVPATPDEALLALQGKYKTADKKYEGLAKKIEQAAKEAIAGAEWRPAGEGSAPRPLAQHPRLVWLDQLSASVSANKRPSDAAAKLLELFPWREMLELTDGLQYGSDRAIPENENGFIVLGAANAPCAGFPELSVNTYLWGLGGVVGWRFRVDDKKPRFQGRGPKDAPEALRELPGWERVRVALLGVAPDTALLALPALTHVLHARGVERRRAADGQLDGLDRFAAFLDSRWNGYIVALPYAKEPLAIVSPIHLSVADRKGFLFRFLKSEELGKVGDLPFISVTTQRDYGEHLLELSVTPSDLIRNTPDATRLIERFWEDCGYLSRYKVVVDSIARAVLTPHVPYPQYLADFDFKGGKLPAQGAGEGEFDVPRGHALLVWAWAGGDPAKVADFLHDEVVAIEGNRFPSKAPLQIVFSAKVRERQAELLKAIGARVEAERAAREEGGGPGDLELELSPFPAFGASGTPALSHLVRHYHAFHEPLSRATSEAAWGLVRAEL